MTYLIDTAKAIDQIESAGFSREQARVIVNTFADVSEQFATKADIERLQAFLEAHYGKDDGLDGEHEAIDSELDPILADIRATFESLKKQLFIGMALTQFGGIVVLFTLLQLFPN